MTALGRAFVGVVPPPGVRDAIDDAVARVRRAGQLPTAQLPTARWTAPERWHVTVRFLGPVADLEALVDALGGVASRTPPCDLVLAGAGAFPAPERARVLWLGVEPAPGLVALAAAVDAAAADLGCGPPDHLPFLPHLTVATGLGGRPAGEAVAALSGALSGAIAGALAGAAPPA